MTQFVFCDGGRMVNWGLVACVDIIHEGEDVIYRLKAADGTILGDTDKQPPATTIIPSPAGLFATVVSVMTQGQPEIMDLVCERRPIIGWRVASDWAEPIVTGDIEGDDTILVELPGGLFSDRGYGPVTFVTIDDAKTEILKRSHAEWDRKQAEKAP